MTSPQSRRITVQLAVIVSVILATESHAAIQVYADKSAFLDATGATSATGPLPNIGQTPEPSYTVGTVTFSAPDGPLWIGANGVPPPYTGDWTILIPGNDIVISGRENLDADLARPVTALGFDFVEPTDGPGVCCPAFDSEFSVTLISHGIPLDSFRFNAPDDVLAFVGIASTAPFDRVEIREVFGGEDDEYFGQFYTPSLDQLAVPEANTALGCLTLLGIVALRYAGRRRVPNRPS